MVGEVIAIVPARGGSKGIPRKNLRRLGGLPLVAWAIRAGLRASHVDRVILTTEDEEIAAVGKEEGAEVWMRPKELARDDATTMSVLRHIVDCMDGRDLYVEAFVLLEPTSPFRTPDIVDRCISKLVPGVATVLSVTQLERNPKNIFSISGDDLAFFVEKPELNFHRRQEFAHLKRLNGCIYVVRPNAIRSGKLLQEPIKGVEMPAEYSVNIDSTLDLALAEVILGRLLGSGEGIEEVVEDVH